MVFELYIKDKCSFCSLLKVTLINFEFFMF